MRLRALATLMLPLAGASCQVFFGVDEPSGQATTTGEGGSGPGTGGAASTSSSVGAGPTECDLCAPAVPPEWEGPVLLATAAGETPSCPNVVAAELVYEGEPAAHTCSSCNCGQPSGECPQATLTCYVGDGCTGTVVYEGTPDGCSLPIVFQDASCKVGPAPAPSNGTCGAVAGMVEGASWGITHALCALTPHQGDCDGGLCFDKGPAPEVGEVCIHRTAHVECPSAWPTRTLAWARADDDRTCLCSCAAVGGACVGGGYGLGAVGCGTSVGPGECKNDVFLADQEAFDFSADCVVSSQGTDGEFVPQDPVTICCRPNVAG